MQLCSSSKKHRFKSFQSLNFQPPFLQLQCSTPAKIIALLESHLQALDEICFIQNVIIISLIVYLFVFLPVHLSICLLAHEGTVE